MEFYTFILALAGGFSFVVMLECRAVRKQHPLSYQMRLNSLLNISIPFLLLLLTLFAITYYASGAAVYSK